MLYRSMATSGPQADCSRKPYTADTPQAQAPTLPRRQPMFEPLPKILPTESITKLSSLHVLIHAIQIAKIIYY